MKAEIFQYLNSIVLFSSIVLFTFFVAFLVNRFFKKTIELSTEQMFNDPTNYLFLRYAIRLLIYIVGFGIAIYIVPQLRTLARSMLAGAGIVAVAIGFAAQHALSNIISGAFIVIFKPFRVNDRIQVRDMDGVIEDITLRHTVIRNFENKRIIIPNTVISDEIIINSDFEDDKICKWLNIEISYESDLELAKKIIRNEVLNHPSHLDGRTEEQIIAGAEKVPVKVINLGEYSIHLRVWKWAIDAASSFNMSCDLYESIWLEFQKNKVEIPYPHRTLVHKSPTE